MTKAGSVQVRLFGKLHALAVQRGLAQPIDVAVPDGGITAEALGRELGLPLEDVEAVFCNHRVYELGHLVHPGDSVAFVPKGTPGPHRFTLGIYDAGRHRP